MNIVSPSEDIEKWINSIHEQSLQQSKETTIDNAPILGMEFDSEDAAFKFYNEYARRIGFGTRREYGNKSKKDGVLTSRRFVRHKEGQRVPDKRDHLIKEPRAETRTLCQARMSVSLKRKIGKYMVIDFVAEHNHPLQPEYAHMILSHRHIDDAQAAQIDLAYETGLTLKSSHEYMAKLAGGVDNVGYTRQDQKNYL